MKRSLLVEPKLYESRSMTAKEDLAAFDKVFFEVIVPELTTVPNNNASDYQDALDWLRKVRISLY